MLTRLEYGVHGDYARALKPHRSQQAAGHNVCRERTPLVVEKDPGSDSRLAI